MDSEEKEKTKLHNIVLNALEYHYFYLAQWEFKGSDVTANAAYIDALEALIRACKAAAKKIEPMPI